MSENVIEARDRFQSPLLLPEEFWAARPVLGHIREAARKRLAPPDLTLGAVLARVAVLSDHRLRIPPPPGSYSPLGLFVCVAASSSGGKSTAMGVAEELLPYRRGHCLLDAMPATGEAFLDLFWGDVPVGDDGKTTERARTVNSVLVSVDEGSLLEKLDGRNGNTLLTFLLSAWLGGTTGTDTLASLGKNGVKRRLMKDTHVTSAVVALQPKKAAHLISQNASGFAQRFVWLSGKDPGWLREPPEDQRIIPLQLDPLWAQVDREVDGHGRLIHEVRRGADVTLEQWRGVGVRREIDHDDSDEIDGHDGLNRLRVAHNLALLDGRLDIDGEDWRLAGMFMAVSVANRRAIGGVVAGMEMGRRRARQEEAVDTALRTELKLTNLKAMQCRTAVRLLLLEAGGEPRAINKGHVTLSLQAALPEALEGMLRDEVIGRKTVPRGFHYYLL